MDRSVSIHSPHGQPKDQLAQDLLQTNPSADQLLPARLQTSLARTSNKLIHIRIYWKYEIHMHKERNFFKNLQFNRLTNIYYNKKLKNQKCDRHLQCDVMMLILS